MKTRDEQIETVWQSITAHSLDEWAAASEIVEQMLPQVSTVEEVLALAEQSLLVTDNGSSWRWSWSHRGDLRELAVALLDAGPLTVVWQP